MAKNKGVKFKIRKSWRRITPLRVYTMMALKPVEKVFVHHTVTPMPASYDKLIKLERTAKTGKERRKARRAAKVMEKAKMRELEQIALGRGFDGISYTDCAFESGRVYMGRGFKYVGAHTLGYNSTGYGISAVGNFEVKAVTHELLTGFANTIRKGVKFRRITKTASVQPHQSVSATACPGRYLKAEIPTIVRLARRD